MSVSVANVTGIESTRTGMTTQRPGQARVLHALRHASPLGMLFAIAIFAFYSLVFVIPFVTAIWLSFQNWDYLTTPIFVGSRNYRELIADAYFWQALRTTLLFSVVEISTGVWLALLLSLMLDHLTRRWSRLFLALYYLPVITPIVVSVYLWRWLYRPTGGAFNLLLGSVGLPEQPFLASTQQALWAITAMVVWANVGGVAVILLAGMKDVPLSLYDAAQIDGAGFWRVFFRITLPLIRPALVYIMVVSVVGTVQMFVPFFLMAGPGFSTRTLALYTYDLGFQSLNLGYGAAVSLVIFLLLLVATIVQLQRWQIKWEY